MQQSLPTLPASRYSCSLSFATIGHAGIVTVIGDLSDGLGLRHLYTFSPTGQGSIDVHALPTHIPLSSTLIAVLNPNLQSPWETPSETGTVYNNAINARPAPFNTAVNIPSLVQYMPLHLPELGGGIGFRIRAWSGRDIDLSIVTGTATSKTRLYRVCA